MKKFTRFAKNAIVSLTCILLFSWTYYYLFLYHYVTSNPLTISLFSFVSLVLNYLPIAALLLLFALLWVREPKFKKLHTELTIFLLVLLLLNFTISLYSSHEMVITEECLVTKLQPKKNLCLVTKENDNDKIKLHCNHRFLSVLEQGETFSITYIYNDLLKKSTPTIIQVISMA